MIRVATLNLLHNNDVLPERVQHLISELITEDLDFLLLQEVPLYVDGIYYAPQHLALELGMPHVTYVLRDDAVVGNIILSKHPLTPIQLPAEYLFPGTPPAIAEAVVDGRQVFVMSHYGARGTHATGERLAQLRILDEVAKSLFTFKDMHMHRSTRPVIILGGDFNAESDAAPIRYITGLDQVLGHSTLWVAAGGDDIGHTTGGPNALITAASAPGMSYRPERAPLRRTTHLFVFEWVYGQAGEPVSARRFADTTFTATDGRELPVSDHSGVLAELWMPEVAVPS